MIRALVCDLDGVIRHYPEARNTEIETRFGLPIGSLLRAAFVESRLEDAVTGRMKDDEWRTQIRELLKRAHPEADAAGAESTWSNFPGVVAIDVMDQLRAFAHGLPFTVLTNGTDRLDRDLAALKMTGSFARVFNSSTIGHCKPDPAIFAHVEKALELSPKDILFIDDSEKHVAAAQARGWRTIHFRGVEFLRQDLDRYR